MTRVDLTQQETADIAQVSRPTVSRWLRGEHRPEHDALRRLRNHLRARHPRLGDLPERLLDAAGYGDDGAAEPASTDPAREQWIRQAREELHQMNRTIDSLLAELERRDRGESA